MTPTVYGPTLRKERKAANVTVTALAERMGITRQTVHAIENMARVPQARAEQYRKGLEA
jgi:transcriptional regulator with XRE-family HTH domain